MPEVRLIDGALLEQRIESAILKATDCFDFVLAARLWEFKNTVQDQATIKAEPVRYGRWIEKPPYSDETVKGLEFQIVCSRCDAQNSSITFDENSVPIAKTFYRTRYCPNCGADMRDGGIYNDT